MKRKWPSDHHPMDYYRAMWNKFTPTMRASFRKFFRRGGNTKRAFDPRTLTALRRRGIIMPIKDNFICPNYRGCELMDYLRHTKQVTRDKVTTPSKE